MRINELRHLIYIQTPSPGQNERGAEMITWIDSPPLRGAVRFLAGNERSGGGGGDLTVPVATYQITLRWPLPTGVIVTPKSRVRWGNRFFGITAVGEPTGIPARLTLNCVELVGEDRIL